MAAKKKPSAKPPGVGDQAGSTDPLASCRGRKLLVSFDPKADTPDCTRQSCSGRDARPDLPTLGVTAVGISPDSPRPQA